MTIRVIEVAGSEEGFDGADAATESRTYHVFDDAVPKTVPSISAMRSAVLAVAPATVSSFIGVLTLDKLSREYVEEGRSWLWTAEYNYVIPESTLTWGFDTQGGSVKVTYAPTDKYPSTAPNFNGGIGFSNGELQGVEKVIPALKLHARYRWPKDTVTTAYVNSLAAMTGTINTSGWQGYAAGELLFLGASGEIVPGKPVEIEYQFAASSNATLTLGSISSIAKRGHDYLWLLWEDDEDTTAKRLTKKMLAAYVAKVYSESSFTGLGIG